MTLENERERGSPHVMPDVIEEARSSRSRCRECRKNIEEGDLRFGQDFSGAYADGAEAHHWYHLRCASRRHPSALLVVLKDTDRSSIEDYDELVEACGVSQKKSAQVFPYGDRAPTGRATCIQCEKPIAKGEYRVAVEREIATGAFTRMGAGYLHPACAPAYIGDPGLADRLIENSPMLSSKEQKELAALCRSAPVTQPSTKKPKQAEPVKPKPRADEGAELVLADLFTEKGDVRGELIMLEAQFARMSPSDDRWLEVRARIAAITRDAERAWKKELGKQSFTLVRGLPAIHLKLSQKTKVPDEKWVMALEVSASSHDANKVQQWLANVLQSPAFTRIRHLDVTRAPFTWDGFRGFCSCDEIKNLESLDIQINLGPRAVLLMLESRRFERLEKLVIQSRFAFDPNTRGFDKAAGLPALRELRLGIGVGWDVLSLILRSPLVSRIEALGTQTVPNMESQTLPNVRRYHASGYVAPATLEAFASGKVFPNLEVLDLGDAVLDVGEAVALFSDPKKLPSLRVLDLSRRVPNNVWSSSIAQPVHPDAIAALRARFGDRASIDGVEIQKKKTTRARRK